MKKINLLLILCGLTINTSVSIAEEIWVDGLITAEGTGISTDTSVPIAKAKIRAFNAAKASAQMELFSALESVTGDSKQLTDDSEQIANVIVTKAKGILKGAFVFNKTLTIEDGVPVSVVTMAVCADRTHPACKHRPTFAAQLGNDFSQLEETKSQHRTISSLGDNISEEALVNTKKTNHAKLNGNKYDENMATSGLVVNLEYLTVSAKSKKIPVIATEKQDSSLQILYSINSMNADSRSKFHPAIYTTKEGIKKEYIVNRLGENILYISAKSIVKDQYGDEIVLISENSVDILNQAIVLNDSFIKNASVAFISN